MVLSRVPAWLAQSGFSQMIREALGDAEARFFVPGRGDCREFNEYKDHRLVPSEFLPEIDDFLEMDTAHAGAYRKFRVVCAGVNDDLRVVCRLLDRARKALPFYTGVASIEDSTFEELAERVAADFGRDRAFAEFLFRKVEVEYELPSTTDDDYLAARFQAQLVREMPECAALSVAQVRAARLALGALVKSRPAAPIGRAELATALRSALPGFEFPTLEATRVHTANEPEHSWHDRSALVFPWERFSGGESRGYPDAQTWGAGFRDLLATRDWVISSGAPRSIRLGGARRLSASVALGAVFSATRGFVLEMENHGEVLRTNQHAGSETPPYEWLEEKGVGGNSDEIAVVVSVKREVAPDVKTFLAGSLPVELILHSSQAMVGAEQTNLAVEKVKEAISSALARTGATVAHLFLAVPSPFALFLGHRLNATCAVQCYEFTGPARYVPAFRVPCM